MFLVKVKNKQSQLITNMARFETEAEIDQWLADCIAVEAFGKPEHEVLVQEAVLEQYDPETGELLVEGTPPVYETIESEYEILPTEDVTLEIEAESLKQTRIQAGKAAREVCQKVLDYIGGSNLTKALTIQQITEMQQTYSNAELALRAGRPTMAKQLISLIEPDGVIVTAQEKQDCLDLLSNY